MYLHELFHDKWFSKTTYYYFQNNPEKLVYFNFFLIFII